MRSSRPGDRREGTRKNPIQWADRITGGSQMRRDHGKHPNGGSVHGFRYGSVDGGGGGFPRVRGGRTGRRRRQPGTGDIVGGNGPEGSGSSSGSGRSNRRTPPRASSLTRSKTRGSSRSRVSGSGSPRPTATMKGRSTTPRRSSHRTFPPTRLRGSRRSSVTEPGQASRTRTSPPTTTSLPTETGPASRPRRTTTGGPSASSGNTCGSARRSGRRTTSRG